MSRKERVAVHDGDGRVIPLGGSKPKSSAPKPKAPTANPPNLLDVLKPADLQEVKRREKADFEAGRLAAEKTLAEIETEEAEEASRKTRRSYDRRMGRAFKK